MKDERWVSLEKGVINRSTNRWRTVHLTTDLLRGLSLEYWGKSLTAVGSKIKGEKRNCRVNINNSPEKFYCSKKRMR